MALFNLQRDADLSHLAGSPTLSNLRQEMALEALDEDRNLWNVQLAVLSRKAFKVRLAARSLRTPAD